MPSDSGSPEPSPHKVWRTRAHREADELKEKLAEAEVMAEVINDTEAPALTYHERLTPNTMEAIREFVRERYSPGVTAPVELTEEEQKRIIEGEPYCFHCGKPASSFPEYDPFENSEREVRGSRADYVRREEGTYNRVTNRFACDECYIAIGMPAAPSGYSGWVAP